MSRPVLLDINLLVALFDPDHVHHDLSHDRFGDNRERGWATCTATESGFVRVVSNPAYGGPVNRPADLVALLRQLCSVDGHQFWADEISLRHDALFDCRRVAGHRQITDLLLLGLAQRRGGSLATFDRTVPVRAVVGARRDLVEVIAPA